MNTKKLIIHGVSIFIILIVIHYLLAPIMALYSVRNDVYSAYPMPHKTNISNTYETLNYPWGIAPTITVFLNSENASIKDKENVLLATKWWEIDNIHNLSYTVNFVIINNSKDANIIINLKEIVYNNSTSVTSTFKSRIKSG